MIKVDIINEVSKAADVTKVKAEVAVEAVLEAMKDSLMKGERIELRASAFSRSSRASAASAGTTGRAGSQDPARAGDPLKAGQGPSRTWLTEGPKTDLRLSPHSTSDRALTRPLAGATIYSGPTHRAAPRCKIKPRRRGWRPSADRGVGLLPGSHPSRSPTRRAARGRAPVSPAGARDGPLPRLRVLPGGRHPALLHPVAVVSSRRDLNTAQLRGTFGAFIRIRGPIPHRRALFDIGIAGPLAGFAVCLPVLALGVLEATWVPTGPPAAGGLNFGEPLLFRGGVARSGARPRRG